MQSDEVELVAEVEANPPGVAYKCPKCPYVLHSQFEYEMHIRNHNPVKFRCRQCSLEFVSEAALLRHTGVCFSSQSFKCVLCKRSCVDFYELNHHGCQKHKGSILTMVDPAISVNGGSVTDTRNQNCSPRNAVNPQSKRPPSQVLAASELANDPQKTLQKCAECSFETKETGKLLEHLSSHLGQQAMNSSPSTLQKSSPKPILPLVVQPQLKLLDSFPENISDDSESPDKFHFPGDNSRSKSMSSMELSKIFPCSICPYTAGRKAHLERHQLTHTINTNDSSFACAECDARFPEELLLNFHSALHATPRKKNRCPDCSYSSAKLCNLRQHQKLFCKARIVQKYTLKPEIGNNNVHLKSTKPKAISGTSSKDSTQILCSECDVRPNSSKDLRKHMLLHSSTKKKFPCPDCSFSTDRLYNLEVHRSKFCRSRNASEVMGDLIPMMKNPVFLSGDVDLSSASIVSPSGVADTTPRAGKIGKFVNSNSPQTSRSEGNKGLNMLQCQQCPFECHQDDGIFRNHMQLHDINNKIFHCTQCSYACSSETFLEIHLMKFHNQLRVGGVKWSNCPDCHQHLAGHNLHRHMLHHIKSWPMKCSQCSYGCSRLSHLQRHMKVHSLGSSDKQMTENHQVNKIQQNCVVARMKEKIKMVKEPKVISASIAVDRLSSEKSSKPFVCVECNYRSSKFGDLKHHLQRHRMVSAHKCSYCSYSCHRLNNLKIHMRVHSAEIEYDTSHPLQPNRKHRKIEVAILPPNNQEVSSELISKESGGCEVRETGSFADTVAKSKKVLSCTECPFRTTYSGHLKNHMQRHIVSSRHKCSYCSYSCNISHYVKQHMNVHRSELKNSGKKTDISFSQVVVEATNGDSQKRVVCQNEEVNFPVKLKKVKMSENLSKIGGNGTNFSVVNKANFNDKLQNQFACPECNYSTNKFVSITRHMVFHRKKFAQQCSLCSYSCTNKINMINHGQYHVNDSPLLTSAVKVQMGKISFDGNSQCPFCSYHSQSFHQIKCHVLSDNCKHEDAFSIKPIPSIPSYTISKSEISCPYCTVHSSDMNQMKKHVLIHSVVPTSLEELSQCLELGKLESKSCYPLNYGLKEHVGSKSGECDIKQNRPSNFPCALCCYSSYSAKTLKIHSSLHGKEGTHVCDMCGYLTLRASNMAMHSLKIHRIHSQLHHSALGSANKENLNEKKCNILKSKNCNSFVNNIIHKNKKIDTQKGNYRCYWCQKTFIKKHNWNNHLSLCKRAGFKLNDQDVQINTYTRDTKCFSCPICCKQFIRKDHCYKHWNVCLAKKGGTSDKCDNFLPCKCDKCDQRFAGLKSLVKHSVECHSNSKSSMVAVQGTALPQDVYVTRYSCIMCGFMTHKKKSYTQHLKDHVNSNAYVCHYCNRSFCRLQSCNKHQSICYKKKKVYKKPTLSRSKNFVNVDVESEIKIELPCDTESWVHTDRPDSLFSQTLEVKEELDMEVDEWQNHFHMSGSLEQLPENSAEIGENEIDAQEFHGDLVEFQNVDIESAADQHNLCSVSSVVVGNRINGPQEFVEVSGHSAEGVENRSDWQRVLNKVSSEVVEHERDDGQIALDEGSAKVVENGSDNDL